MRISQIGKEGLDWWYKKMECKYWSYLPDKSKLYQGKLEQFHYEFGSSTRRGTKEKRNGKVNQIISLCEVDKVVMEKNFTWSSSCLEDQEMRVTRISLQKDSKCW